MKNYYRELPDGFTENYSIDAKNKKFGIIFNVVALVVAIVVFLICYFTKFYGAEIEYSANTFSIFWLGLVVILIGYLIVHELTHGLFYWLFTKQKLTFGITWSVAFCGLKEGYVNKLTSLITTLAPFVIHSIWMVLVIALVSASPWILVLTVVFALHIGGCVGDIYVAFILLIKYNKKQVLVSDNGTKQTFYVKEN